MSMRELAFFCDTSHVTIQRLEAGTSDASVGLKVRLARALGVRVDALWTPLTSNAPDMSEGVAKDEAGGPHNGS